MVCKRTERGKEELSGGEMKEREKKNKRREREVRRNDDFALDERESQRCI